MMKPCPVAGCDTLIRDGALVCNDDWVRLPRWAREDLDRLGATEAGSDLHRRTINVALAYLDDPGVAEAEVAG